MTPVLVMDLALCGALTAGLTLLAKHFQPDLPHLTLFTGLVGGALCVLWAVLSRRAMRCRLSSMVTLTAMACVFVRQAVQSWGTSAEGGWNGRQVASLMMVQVVFCVGMLANLVRKENDPKS